MQFYSDGSKASAPFYFDMHNPHECSQTWQVERGQFDGMLLDNAVAKGATAHTKAHVLDTLWEGDQAVGVKVKLTDSDEPVTREIRAKIVVDATGQSAFLATRLKLKESDPRLRKATIWTYWKGAHRDPGKDEGATLILQTKGKQSWFWYIPLQDDIVSVGCTGDLAYMFNENRSESEAIYQEELERCPALQDKLQHATRAADYFTTKDFSYYASQGAGPGWMLVGDAFGFIDPVYSSGVFLALKSGEFAADAIHEGLSANDVSGERLSAWHSVYSQGVDHFRQLVYAFYARDFSFGDFLREHPQFKTNLVDILIGDVFKPGVGDMFAAIPKHPAMMDQVAS